MKAKLSTVLRNLSHVDLRVLVLACGISLVFFSARSDFIDNIDYRIVQLSSFFFSSPKGTSDIAMIEIPSEEIETWQRDIHATGRLSALLSNVLHASPGTVGIMLQRPLNLSKNEADVLFEQLLSNKKYLNFNERKKVGELFQAKQYLLEYLNDPRVIVGVRHGNNDQIVLSSQGGLLSHWPMAVLRQLWPSLYTPASLPAVKQQNMPVSYSLTALSHSFPQQQLVLGNPRQSLYPTFFTRFLAAAQLRSVGSLEELIWKEDSGLHSPQAVIPASPEGTFMGVYSLTPRLHPRIERIPLNEAFSRSAFPNYIFIANQDNTDAIKIANNFYSAQQQRTLYKPWWLYIVQKLLLLASTIYLCFVVPKLKWIHGVASTLSVCFTLYLIQVTAIHLSHQLLVFTLNVCWLLCGHGLIVFWKLRSSDLVNSMERAEEITILHADTLFENAKYSQLEDLLTTAPTSTPILEKLYQLARVYAEKRRYTAALSTLKTIAARRGNFLDTEQKIMALQAMVESQSKTQVQGEPTSLASEPVDLAPMEHKVLGRYKVKQELGRGAMGVVYLGFDPKISRKVAIKTFRYKQFKPEQVDQLKNRFYREAEAAGRLNHPNIVSVYDVGEEDEMAFIAMDFAPGSSLGAFTSNTNLLPVSEVYRVVCEVAQALNYAHENQIVHRDIKPGNIMYSPSPFQVKVTDFGIARLMDDSRTSTGEILGSPLYMSPEQLKGKKVSGASDIFSLGVTFYQLLTGALPFLGDNLASLTYEIIHGKHKSIRTVRRELPVSASRIINQCLQKSPQDRYESAGEMAMALKKALRKDFSQYAKKIGYV